MANRDVLLDNSYISVLIEESIKMKALYQKLLENDVVDFQENLYPFYHQVGKDYFKSESRCLFVGKSINGWVTNSRDVNTEGHAGSINPSSTLKISLTNI